MTPHRRAFSIKYAKKLMLNLLTYLVNVTRVFRVTIERIAIALLDIYWRLSGWAR